MPVGRQTESLQIRKYPNCFDIVYQSAYPPETITWFDKYDCVLLVLCAEACCAMGDLGSARDYLTKAAKQAAWFDGVDSSKICDSKLFAEMGIMKK